MLSTKSKSNLSSADVCHSQNGMFTHLQSVELQIDKGPNGNLFKRFWESLESREALLRLCGFSVEPSRSLVDFECIPVLSWQEKRPEDGGCVLE